MIAPTPQGQDTVSQMKSYLQQSGYTPPAPTAPTGSGDWYDQVLSTRQKTSDASMGGFGKVVGDIGNTFNTHADEVGQILNSKDNPASKLLQVGGQGAAVVNDTAGDVIKSAIKPEVLQSIGDMIGHAADSPIVTAMAQSPVTKGIISWFSGLSPETQNNLKATGSIASLLSNAVGGGAAKEVGTAGGEAALNAAKDITAPVNDAALALKTGTKNLVKDTFSSTKQAVQKVAANGKIPGIEGLGEQAKTSAERLVPSLPLKGAGAAIRPTPLQAYDQFAGQEAKHLADIKEDPAISLVGSRIGKAFDSVIKQRQAAGKTMASELEKTATKPMDVQSVRGDFQQEMLDNGGTFDASTGEIKTGSDSKFATADKNILQKYASELHGLGNNPTMKQVDAFVSRMPKEIEGLKASSGINFQTNAERLINKNISSLRDSLGKEGTPEYKAARKTYSDLSNFVNEGAGHLGKLTQSGDFAKDASLAKSSVQSVLNNGKKDWLIKLEHHTGYPALDEATLALQAMKDAGDFKGNSMLELLTEGAKGAVAGPHGTIAGMLTKAGKVVAGSKAEQTRAFLREIGKIK